MMSFLKILSRVLIPQIYLWWTEKGKFAGFSLHFRRNDVHSWQQPLMTYIKKGK